MNRVCLYVVLITVLYTVQADDGITQSDSGEYCTYGDDETVCVIECTFSDTVDVYLVAWYIQDVTDSESEYIYNSDNIIGQAVYYYGSGVTDRWYSPGTFTVNTTHVIEATSTSLTLYIYNADSIYSGTYSCKVTDITAASSYYNEDINISDCVVTTSASTSPPTSTAPPTEKQESMILVIVGCAVGVLYY